VADKRNTRTTEKFGACSIIRFINWQGRVSVQRLFKGPPVCSSCSAAPACKSFHIKRLPASAPLRQQLNAVSEPLCAYWRRSSASSVIVHSPYSTRRSPQPNKESAKNAARASAPAGGRILFAEMAGAGGVQAEENHRWTQMNTDFRSGLMKRRASHSFRARSGTRWNASLPVRKHSHSS
jgi:hypothetical protein